MELPVKIQILENNMLISLFGKTIDIWDEMNKFVKKKKTCQERKNISEYLYFYLEINVIIDYPALNKKRTNKKIRSR